MSKFMVNQHHPLIPREQNYVLERKIISIHSFDRDIKKWPNSNHFEIDLPEDFTDIQSIQLVQITLPNNQYVFTNSYQNTKLSFTLTSGAGVGPYTITISEGSYTADQLAIEIATKMNKAVAAVSSGYNSFVCKYNAVTNTFWFGNTADSFTLTFGTNPGYIIPCGQTEVWPHYTKWGLPAYLGYEKKTYTTTGQVIDSSGFGFDYEFPKFWLEPSGGYYVDISNNNCNLDIFGEECIYMEINKYNSLDEIEPFSENTMAIFNNDYSGKIDSAFAKIPINHANAFALYGDSTNFFIMNASQYIPPIQRLRRVRFTFRYHDGRLVDFKWLPFNFSLRFNMLRNEPAKKINIHVPVI